MFSFESKKFEEAIEVAYAKAGSDGQAKLAFQGEVTLEQQIGSRTSREVVVIPVNATVHFPPVPASKAVSYPPRSRDRYTVFYGNGGVLAVKGADGSRIRAVHTRPSTRAGGSPANYHLSNMVATSGGG